MPSSHRLSATTERNTDDLAWKHVECCACGEMHGSTQIVREPQSKTCQISNVSTKVHNLRLFVPHEADPITDLVPEILRLM